MQAARFAIFSRIDRYVLSVIFKPMRNIFLFVIIILECVRFRLGLGLAINQDNLVSLMLTYLGQWLALYAGLAMQIALAIGVMLGFANLARNRELDAMHAMGFSLHRLAAAPAVAAVAVAILDFAVLGWLQPLSVYDSANFVHQAQRFVSLLPEGGNLFVSGDNKTVIIDNILPKSNSFGKIFVYQTYPDGKTVTTGGSKGHLTILDDDPNQYYDVKDVRMIQILTKPSDNGKTALPEAYNASSSSQLRGPIQAIDTSHFRLRGESEWELTLPELVSQNPPNNFTVASHTISAELNYRIVQLLFILLLPFIAIVFVVEPRRNPGPFRFLGGLLTILGFHQFLGMAVSFSRTDALPVWLTLWLPLFVMFVAIGLRLRWLSLKPGFSVAR